MKKTFLTILMLAGCVIACFAALTSFNGKWAGQLQTDSGDVYPLLYTFKIDGNNLTGTAKTPKGDMPIEDGKITGTDFKFTVTVANIEVLHTGKFYGDSTTINLEANGAKVHSVLTRAGN